MIRTYTISELEDLTGVSKRTISDYITKGLLLGPSHRGRGAVYSQHDLYALRVIPKLRALFKEQYGSLKAIAAFLANLSMPDLQRLAARAPEHAFSAEVRRLRLRSSLMALMPHVAPEKLDEVVKGLTPEQIRRVDSGQVQIGTVIDLQPLFASEEQLAEAGEPAYPHKYFSLEDTDQLPQLRTALLRDDDPEETRPLSNGGNGGNGSAESYRWKPDAKVSAADKLISEKLDEIGSRLDRVEQMLDHDH